LVRVNFKTHKGQLVSVDVRGHSGYAEEGNDIVCAAVSSAVMLTHALLYDVQRIPVETVVEDEGARIYIALPENGIEQGQDALRALKLHFTELEENYSEFLNVRVTEVLEGC